MAAETSKQETRKKKPEAAEITFKCRRCGRQRPLQEMRSITRFVPVLIVCQDCQKEMQ